MKIARFHLILLLLFLSITISAQDKEYNFKKDFYTSPQVIELTESNKILIGVNQGRNLLQATHPYLIVMDASGEILWEYTDFVEEIGTITKIIPLKNEFFYVIGNGREGCDFGGYGFVFRFDESGNLISKSDLTDRIYPINEADVFDNENLLLLTRYSIEKRTKENELVYFEYIPEFEIKKFKQVVTTVGDDFLMSGSPNDNDCRLVYMEVHELDDLFWDYCRVEGFDIKQLFRSNSENYFYAISDQYILKLDSYGYWYDFYEFDNTTLLKAKLYDEHLYMLKTFNSNHVIIKADTLTLEVKDTILLNLSEDQFPVDFVVLGGDQVRLLGQQKSPYNIIPRNYFDDLSESSAFIRRYQFGRENNSFPNTDAGVSNARVNRLPSYSTSKCEESYCGPNADIKYDSTFVTVTNYGTDTIRSVYINAQYDYCSYCEWLCYETQTFSKRFDGFTLAPQESMEFAFDSILIIDQADLSNHELCFWTSVPDEKLDKNTANDYYCDQFDLVLSNKERTLKEQLDINIYFNSFDKQLSLASTALMEGKIKIIDLLGRPVTELDISLPTNEVNIPFDFSLNIYIAIYSSEEREYAYKFVNR